MLLSVSKQSPNLCLAATILLLTAATLTAQDANPVIEWNRNLLSLVRTPGMQPANIQTTRNFAIMHLAMDRAADTIAKRHQAPAELIRASVTSAAYRALVGLYPNASTILTAEYQASLATMERVPGFIEALAAGQRSAASILREREEDGSNATATPYVFGTEPGLYQSTPPNFPKQPQFVNWRNVAPFALRTADQFRPEPPPTLTSPLYAKALGEVQSLGATVGSTASADQMLTGKFWNGSIQNYWNEIAQTLAVQCQLSTLETAHLFARLNITLADAVIAFYDAKYQYNFWRPVTAIREADPATTPNASPNPMWLPETGNTAPDPSYPGAHAVVSAAAAEVLISTLNTGWLSFDVTSEVISGVKRHFDSISEAQQEASRSRVYAGAHFSFDLTAGERLGRQVAAFVLDHTDQRRRDW